MVCITYKSILCINKTMFCKEDKTSGRQSLWKQKKTKYKFRGWDGDGCMRLRKILGNKTMFYKEYIRRREKETKFG